MWAPLVGDHRGEPLDELLRELLRAGIGATEELDVVDLSRRVRRLEDVLRGMAAFMLAALSDDEPELLDDEV